MQEISKEMLKKDEGLRLKPYRCSANKLTIGYGRNLDDDGITKKEAELLLEYDILITEEYLKKYSWFNNLSSNRKDVLINMCFNLGETKFLKFEKMIKALNAKDYNTASKEMLNSKWSRQLPLRAKRLAAIMRKG